VVIVVVDGRDVNAGGGGSSGGRVEAVVVVAGVALTTQVVESL